MKDFLYYSLYISEAFRKDCKLLLGAFWLKIAINDSVTSLVRLAH